MSFRIIILIAIVSLLGATCREAHGVYNSDRGRWLTRDPLGNVGGPNTNAYANGNPNAGTDAFGLIFAEILNPDGYPLGGFFGCPHKTKTLKDCLACVGDQCAVDFNGCGHLLPNYVEPRRGKCDDDFERREKDCSERFLHHSPGIGEPGIIPLIAPGLVTVGDYLRYLDCRTNAERIRDACVAQYGNQHAKWTRDRDDLRDACRGWYAYVCALRRQACRAYFSPDWPWGPDWWRRYRTDNEGMD